MGGRDADSFREWLDSHPGVAVVSRDRSTDYTAAIAATGRDITEVADRFHLIKNMSDCVKKVIGSHYDDYRESVGTATAQRVSGKGDSRQVMFDEVKELQGSGLNIAQIAKKLEIAKQTLRKYMKLKCYVSIHAPTRGATLAMAPRRTISPVFQSTHPRGVRRSLRCQV